jgi:hypothetical protein
MLMPIASWLKWFQQKECHEIAPKQFIDAAKTDGGGLGHVRLWLCPHPHLQTHL